ncbi:MAG TPA: glycosyltransferase family 39 protein [Planctomycetota bacterium]|nr:glycosyltransferase family 39 protein [Planctomycetota bacterium]
MNRARWLLLAACAWLLWIAPIKSGLTLDETSTAWVVDGSLGETVHRASLYQGQSPLYYVLVRLVVLVFGGSEAVLRAPSVVATALATLVVARIGRRIFDPDVGFYAAAAFVSTADVVYAASDARPYALGVFLAAAATLALVEWVETRRTWLGLLYAALAASIVYVHYLFASTLLVHALYLVARVRTGRPVPSARSLALAGALVGVALAPLVPQAGALEGRHRAIEYSPLATWESFVGWLLPQAAIVPIVAGLACALGRQRLAPPAASADSTALVLGWHLVPRVSIFVFSRYVFRVFLSRYVLNAAPGFALLLGWGIAALPTRRIANAVACLMLLASCASFASKRHSREDWKLTARCVREALGRDRAPVVMNVGFVESMQPDWLEGDAERRSFLLAPLSRYDVGGEPVPFPLLVAPETRAYVERVASRLERCERFIFVTPWAEHADPPPWSWLQARLAPFGFVTRTAADTGWYRVFELERSSARAPR